MTTKPSSPSGAKPSLQHFSRAREAQTQELVFLGEITHALAATESLEVVLPLILDRLRLLFRCQATAVVGLSAERQELILLALDAAEDAATHRGRAFSRPGTLVDRALATRLPIMVQASGPAAFDPMIQFLAGGRRPESGVVLPLRTVAGERGGLVIVNKPEPFSSEDLRLLIAFADQAAIAIDRAEARRNRQGDTARLRVLNTVLQVTSAGFEEEALIRRSMDALLGVFSAERAELVTHVSGEVRVRYRHVGAPGGNAAPDQDRRNDELISLVLATGEPRLLSDALPGNASNQAGGAPYAACLPLKARDRVMGALLVLRRVEPIDEQDLDMLAAVGRHIGTAIELSRLFRRAVTEAEQLERLAAERQSQLRETQERLARSQWLASLGELAAGVAHDLNNALNPIVAFAELIRENVEEREQIRTYAERILMAAQGGAETVRRIQRFTRRRMETLPFETLPLAALVQEVVELSRPLWTSRSRGPVQVLQSVADDLMVEVNAGELRQALLNLIGNALDAISKGGGMIRLVGRMEDDQIAIAVQDTGSGMVDAVRERALEPFYTTKGAHGTGLGLAEVYGIARRHGGTLDLESWEGIGTTVMIRLPRARLGPALPKAPARSRSGQSLHILLVDDNLLSLEATAASLRGAGHRVATAPNAGTALQLFSAGEFDLVLSDIGLPDMSGWDLIDELRAVNPEVRIGVVTGWALPEGDEELQERGIELIFVKPIDNDQLLAAL